MAEQTHIINFKANVQGLDKVMQQFEKILGFDNLNLTESMQKQWQQLKTMASSYIEQMNNELAKPAPDMNALETLDKRLTQIISKTTKFSDALAKLMLPRDLADKIAIIQKQIADLNEKNKELNAQRRGKQTKLNSANESGLAKTEEKRVFRAANAENGPIEIGDTVITS